MFPFTKKYKIKIMKKIFKVLLVVGFTSSLGKSYCQTQPLVLQGVISVWNEKNSAPISLIDDFYYGLCVGDKIKITVTGNANLAPRDEEREGGGFLGLFKKKYTVRIDNWIDSKNTFFSIDINGERKDLSGNQLTNYEWTIPFEPSNGESLKNVYKVTTCVNQPRSPLRAGQYNIKVEVDSKDRITFLRTYFTTMATKPTLSFKNLKEYVEAGKLIYRDPDEIVKMIEEVFVGNDNLPIIEKDLYQYLLSFAPNNTGVRKKLADVYLKEFNFSEALENAKKIIEIIYAKYPEAQFTPQDKADLGSAYATLGSVDEQKELGLNENAYTKASFFFGESSKWFLASGGLLDKYSESIFKQVRCLQKINNIESLKSAADIVEKQIKILSTVNTNKKLNL